MPRTTPITDFLFRLEVDSDFVNRVLDEDQRDAALTEYELDEEIRNEIASAITSGDFRALQTKVLEEHPDSNTLKILPRGWVR